MSENGLGDSELIQTTDEEGNIHVFEKVGEFEVDGKPYALMIYQGTDEEVENEEFDDSIDDEVIVMKVGYEDGLEVYENIEDEKELEKVLEHLENYEDDEIVIDLGNLLEEAKNSPEAKNAENN